MRGIFAALSIALSSAISVAQANSARLGALQRLRSARFRVSQRAAVTGVPSARVVHNAHQQFVAGSTKADKFHVDGSKIPLLNATVQDSYADRLPIALNDTRSLFFWYWSSSAKHSDSLTIWLNGASSTVQENGPFTYRPGTEAPTINDFAWSTVSDMLYVDQPISTGFSSGEPDIVDEIGVGNKFYGFLQQFYTVFPELLHKKLYLAGESYAGMYIPYIANRIVTASPSEKAATPIDLQSILINDGVYSSDLVSEAAPMAGYLIARQHDIGIDDAAVQEVRDLADSESEDCGFQKIMAQLVYPPNGPILPGENAVPSYCYDVALDAYNAGFSVTQCFNLYRITDKCPELHDPIEDYFSRADVQEALHVKDFGPWGQCGAEPLLGRDKSPYSDTVPVIPGLVEALPRGVTLWHGLDDILLLANGTRLTIQNMTWEGLQGFQKPITKQILFEGKPHGVQHSERGLTYYENMVPLDQPSLALEVFKTVQYSAKERLLWYIPTLANT